MLLGLVIYLAAFGMIVWQVGVVGPLVRAKSDERSSVPERARAHDPLVPADVDCSKIRERGIDKQENMRAGAIMIHCGQAKGGIPLEADGGNDAYGGADVNLITGMDTLPNVTQSETFTAVNPDGPNQIVVAYNDSRGREADPINISGASVSTDGGTTFTRLTAAGGQSPFSNTYGDPVVLYNKPTATWFTVWLDGACGGQGLGGYKSTTPWDPSPVSWSHYCVHSGEGDDRESGWADNNPASPFYGRMYVSWNDFATDASIFVSMTTDNGLTWSGAVQVTTGFIRNVQITGDAVTGHVYLAGMEENGGQENFDRNNLIYKSTDGGNTWANTYSGPTFSGAHRGVSGYFACMYNDPPYWRHQGWGQPAAFNNVVSYVYAAANTASGDPGDVFYIRSTDGGVTFGAPFKLNTNEDPTKAQWQPNLSVSPAGTLLSTWYDETPRTGPSCQPSSSSTPCYQMYSRRSFDNGLTWAQVDTMSDVVSPLPLQPDPGIVDVYAGDYDYGSAVLTKHATSWVDGRVALSGSSQQNAFTDRELVGFAVATTTPLCGSIIGTQPADFVMNLSDAVDPATVQTTDFTVNGVPASSFTLSNGNTTITFSYAVSPVAVQGVQTMNIPSNAFTRTSDGMGVFPLACTFRYDAVQLAVTTTDPQGGGTFEPAAPRHYQYDVTFNEPVDPASIQASDLVVNGNSVPSVLGVMMIQGNTAARFTLHMNFGGTLSATIGQGAVTDTFGNPNVAFAASYSVSGCPPQNRYNIAQIGGSIVPGTTDIGNHVDDGTTRIPLPFAYSLYGQPYTNVGVSSNGNIQFVTSDAEYNNVCLPWNTMPFGAVLPYWDDLRTDNGPGCGSYPASQCGIFTSVTGSAPNRIFNIEWRTVYYAAPENRAHFELRLYEGQNRFDVIYGEVPNATTSATAGVQQNQTSFDQYFCNGVGGAATGGQSYTLQTCTTPGGRTAFDYDGDALADVSVFRPAGATWYILRSTGGVAAGAFGYTTDRIAPADFDGDGKTDVAVYRPSAGTWYWVNSSIGTLSAVPFGTAEDLPTAADYDGDGRADISVFRPSNGVWYRLNSSNGSFYAVQFGASDDKPTIGDYDADGHADIAVFRPLNGVWYRLNSSNGQFVGVSFGFSTDLITPADFDGDAKTDAAVYRPSSGTWFWLNSTNGGLSAVPFGTSEDIPVAADFDGDGKADVSVFRPSNGVWYRLNSGNGSFFAVQFGTSSDRPTPAAFMY